jgi:glycosyltransferase involved in cell wall biosynthesis
MTNMKLAIVSHVLPPSSSGQAMALHRLLAEAEPDRYCLISRQDYGSEDSSTDQALKLPGSYHHLRPEPQLSTGQRFGVGRVTRALNLWFRTIRRARSILQIIRQEACSAVIACSGDLADPPAAYLASRREGIPFYLHAFDDYVNQWALAGLRRLAGWAERFIMRGAAGVIVPNEFLGHVYSQRYGIEPHLVHNPSLSTGEESGPEVSWPARAGELGIVYTGAVYHAQNDAFRNLSSALDMMERSDVRLDIYSAQSRAQLEQEGIRVPIEVHEHLSPAEARRVQQQADILFLPLSFHSSIQEVVRTSAPGKMGEYLASGRPVLVHAPSDSYVSWYFKQHGCGVVVDENDPGALLAGILSIIEDKTLRVRLLERARIAARRDFSLPTVRAAYWGLFETTTGA